MKQSHFINKALKTDEIRVGSFNLPPSTIAHVPFFSLNYNSIKWTFSPSKTVPETQHKSTIGSQNEEVS